MKRHRWLRWAGSVVMAAALLASCTTEPSSSSGSPQKEPTCVRDKTQFALDDDNYADLGKPGNAKGTSLPFVVVFDEQHLSRVGQVEIALMLNRLYHTANLRDLGLEGAVLEKPAPNLSWFTSRPDESTRVAVALQMLKEGEVSAAEFAAMVLPGFHWHPVERENEYRVDMSDKAAQSYTTYLVAIAETTMTSDQIAKANALLDQEKSEEAIRFIVDTNPWTSKRYQLLKRTTPATTTEMKKLGAELEQKATEVGADVAEDRNDLQAARTFYETAGQRSTTIAANTADLAAGMNGCAPIAMEIGAAHTAEATSILSQRNTSYAVVSPLSLLSESVNGDLSDEAYDRKLAARSVDPAGALGALLDGRRKPSPASLTEWFQIKAETSYATIEIARAAAGGVNIQVSLLILVAWVW